MKETILMINRLAKARFIKKKRKRNQIVKLKNEKRRGYNRQCRNIKDYKKLL